METRYIDGVRYCLSEEYQNQLVYVDCEVKQLNIGFSDFFSGGVVTILFFTVLYIWIEQKNKLEKVINQAERSLR
jgi:hypothetical protein